MSDCCLTNLGCLQIPTSVISTVGQAGANGQDGQDGGAGGAGPQGPPGFVRVAYNLPDILSGTGGTSTPKIFITQTIDVDDMPQTEGSSLVLTFNIQNRFNATFISTSQFIGVKFGGVSCIVGSPSGAILGNVVISKTIFFETQVKVEVIRGIDSTVGYARVSFSGVDQNGYSVCYTESNPLTGLNFGLESSFEITGRQIFEDGFKFSLLTVDKIIAQ